MKRIKQLFANKYGLHQRVELYLAHSSVPRIGLIPYEASRESVAGVLENITADPLGDAHWMPTLKSRSLAKDTLVVQSAKFEYVETRNSIVEYPVPSAGKPVEYLEVSDQAGSIEHLETCDFWVYLSSSPHTSYPMTDYPHMVVVDDGNVAAKSPQNLLHVDIAAASKANDSLRQSPGNISSYLKTMKESNFDALKSKVSDVTAIRKALRDSILATCESQVPKVPSSTASEISTFEWTDLREQWSADAHRELQLQFIPALKSTLHGNLAWWKLYARTDDVDMLLRARLADSYLPDARKNLAFIVGQQKGSAQDIQNIEQIWRNAKESANIASTSLQNKALWAVVSVLGGIQAPLAGLSVAGAYFLNQNWYAMGAVALLGIVVGLRRLQSYWLAASQAYIVQVEDTAKEAIVESEQALFNLNESEAEKTDLLREEMLDVIANIRAEHSD